MFNDSGIVNMLRIRAPIPGRMTVRVSGAVTAVEDISAYANDGVAIEIHAEGADLYVAVGPTNAITANPAAVGTAVAVGGTPIAGLCARIPVDQSKRFYLGPNEKFLAYRTGTGNGTIRIEANSDGSFWNLVKKLFQY
jgi:hypothetical protein